ncbi:MAG: FAD-binding oxidoreductase [Solirubrobacterales bacterium]
MPRPALQEPIATGVADEEFHRRVKRLREQYLAIPPGAPVRLAKRTSNLFRRRADTERPGLDVSAFDGVLSVDPGARTAEVQGMTTYEHLVEATLAHGLMPLVVPQLRTITLGGAVTGLGIESASFRNGLPHESVLELELITGDGRIVVARPEGEHAELFHGFPNSYGTLGYALRLRIELEPVRPYVRLRHLPFADPGAYFAAAAEVAETRAWDGEPVDFMDGTVFAAGAHFLTLGTMVEEASSTSDYTGQQIYYRSIPRRREDHLTIHDYLWRWDTDWFWCSRSFGVQRPRIRRLWPDRWKRSDVYWRIIAFERRHQILARLDRLRGRPGREDVIQDVEVPVERAAEFLEAFHREIGMTPIWMCPLRLRQRETPWTLYRLDPDATYVNFGFWGQVERRPGAGANDRNLFIEELVAGLGGHKSLYSTSFYEREEFHRLYGGEAYDELKAEYDPDRRLLDLYEKCVEGS